MKIRAHLAMVALSGGLVAVPGLAAPQAEVFSTKWQLDFAFHDMQRISLVLPGDSDATTFWYLLFEVTNQTGRDVELYPSFELVTDTLQVVEGGANISPSVYDAIAARHRNEFPFFAPPAKITGTQLQGRENARSSAAVFRTFDPAAARFTVYVSGLSGELVRVSSPVPVDSGVVSTEPMADSFILRRTLAIVYDLPGDSTTRAGAQPIRRTREWVMR